MFWHEERKSRRLSRIAFSCFRAIMQLKGTKMQVEVKVNCRSAKNTRDEP